ncbi:MAG: rhodanese-like domain-containing protein [Candidatus Izemoplasma sp.]|nr:rhodanese-like domain-containing protein [Candidatus Izemoplasma sp.]
MTRLFSMVSVVIMVLTLAACNSQEYTDISNEELKTMLANEKYQFVDVRTSEEFYTERIPGFTYNIDYYMLVEDYSLLDRLDKDVPVVIMCNSGNRSADAAEIFVDQGFETVYNLENGIVEWDGETE